MIKTAMILAPDEMGLQPVFGIPAVRRLALLVRRMGLQTVHIMGRVHRLSPVLSDLIPAEAIHAVENPAGLYQAVGKLGLAEEDRVLLLTADLVIDRYTLTQFVEAGKKPGVYCMRLEERNTPRGLYLGRLSDLAPVFPDLWGSGDTASVDFCDSAQQVPGVAGLPDVVTKGVEHAKLLEAKLLASLSCQTEAHDGFLARHVDRRISQFISKRLVHTSVTPNQITLGGAAIGLIGAFLLSRPGYRSQLMGSLVFLFCIIVDGVDGEVARLKLQESVFGHYLDVVTDNIVHVAVFAGIAFGLYHNTGDQGYLHALWLLMGGFGLCAAAVYHYILRPSAHETSKSSKITTLMTLLTNRDFAYLVVLLAILNRLAWFLIGAAVGTYLFAAALWLISMNGKRKQATVSQ